MTTLSDMLDDMRMRLSDPDDSLVDLTTKIRYLNQGLRATWPSIFRIVRDTSIILADGVYEYNLGADILILSEVFRVEISASVGELRWYEWPDFEIVSHNEQPILLFRTLPLGSIDGLTCRVSACVPLTELALPVEEGS